MSMSASISVANLSWSSPDGHPVLSDLSLSFQPERTGVVGRNGVGKTTLLKLLTGELQPSKGRIAVTGRIGTLRQIVQHSPEETVADLLGVASGLEALRRAEAGVATAEELADTDWTLDARAAEALVQVGLDVPLEASLARLSGGQRTRAALAGVVFAQPDFLLLDEPTNDLDREGRGLVHALLQGWRGGAVVVSHDRELLEAMDAIVELTTLGASRYGGNWSAYRVRKELELTAAERDFAAAERRMGEVARRAQQAIERKARRDAAGSRKAGRGDQPRILLGARRNRAEKSGGENVRLADRQRTEAGRVYGLAKEQIERIETLIADLAQTGLAPSQRVLDVEAVRFGYASDHAILQSTSLSITGPERVAITGPNGSGKSTLLGIVAGQFAPWSGRVTVHVPFALFDQSVSILDAGATIAENFARLNPGVGENGCRAALARFQFRAEAANQSVGALSGGQILRAGLACVLGGPNPPRLLILDEPTNHLDIESVAAVEAGLLAHDGALLVVSHDETFLDAIGVTRRIVLV